VGKGGSSLQSRGQHLLQIQGIISPQTARNVTHSAELLPALLNALAGTIEQERSDLRELGGSLRRSAAELERAVASGRLERTVERTDTVLVQLDAAATRSLARVSHSIPSWRAPSAAPVRSGA
jgi:hypothetical protein